jgi:hypothetical protein
MFLASHLQLTASKTSLVVRFATGKRLLLGEPQGGSTSAVMTKMRQYGEHSNLRMITYQHLTFYSSNFSGRISGCLPNKPWCIEGPTTRLPLSRPRTKIQVTAIMLDSLIRLAVNVWRLTMQQSPCWLWHELASFSFMQYKTSKITSLHHTVLFWTDQMRNDTAQDVCNS